MFPTVPGNNATTYPGRDVFLSEEFHGLYMALFTRLIGKPYRRGSVPVRMHVSHHDSAGIDER